MYKKIAVILLLLALAVLAIGFYYFSQVNNKTDDQTGGFLDNLTSEEVEQTNNNENSETPVNNNDRAPRSKEVLERTIDKEMTIKATQIKEEATDRNYTQDELNFLFNPRKTTINNLATEGELTNQEIELLK